MLTIEKTLNAPALTVALIGRLDTTTAPELEKELKASAQKTMNRQGTMKLTHVNETIMEIFEVTGFSDILTVE